MIKTNYYASIEKNGKKIAERRVYQEESIEPRFSMKNMSKEYIFFQKCLWDVDQLIDEGYKVYYRYTPSNFGAFMLLDIALSQPFERKRSETTS